jgi:hypothetical protein
VNAQLQQLKSLVLDARGAVLDNAVAETEGSEYGAHHLTIDGLSVHFRVARTTPKKVGQFVTFWKRATGDQIEPFDVRDDFDRLIVVTWTPKSYGYFEFPKHALSEHGVLTVGTTEGKRGFRVYPEWDEPNNRSGVAAQTWQLNYFSDLSDQI